MKILLKFIISILVFTILLPAVSFAVPMFTITPTSTTLNLPRNGTGDATFTVTNSIGTNISANISYTANINPNTPFQSSVSPSSTCGPSLLKGQSCQLVINVQAGSSLGSGLLLPRVCYRNDCSTTAEPVSVMVTVMSNMWMFTPCGATGADGPTMAQCNAAYANTDLAGEVTISGSGIQQWTVPATGTYRIEAFGAQGASAQGHGIVGGLGADMRGDFTLTAGQVLNIVVGQMGIGQASGTNGGGGGGSFVVTSTGTILVIAGGGGGTRVDATVNGFNAVTGTTGVTGHTEANGVGGSSCAGGTAGSGGAGCPDAYGNGGGGYIGNGGTDGEGTGGLSFINGAVGGHPICTTCGSLAFGGFGGGGCGTGDDGGGGGGGYSGGGGGFIAGGGASFNSGANQLNTAGVKSGNGVVTINTIS